MIRSFLGFTRPTTKMNEMKRNQIHLYKGDRTATLSRGHLNKANRQGYYIIDNKGQGICDLDGYETVAQALTSATINYEWLVSIA